MPQSSRKQIGLIFTGASVLALLLLAYAYFIEPYRLVVTRSEITLDGWGREFDGMRFVLISDIHGGSHGVDDARIRQIVEMANAQDADAVFLLGDYVATTNGRKGIKMPVAEIANALSGLRAKHGVFAVLGNHDGWFGDASVESELERVGIKVLNGEVAIIERNGRRLRILGLPDHFKVDSWQKTSADAKALIAESEGTGNIIVLEHSPDVLQMITGDLLISSEFKLMFSGHTHGGQIWLPILGYPIVPSSVGQKYAAGHVNDAGIDMFVTTGIGTSILPFRFMVPPAIAVVTVRPKQP